MSVLAICHSLSFGLSNALSVCSRLLKVMIRANRVQLVQLSLVIFHCSVFLFNVQWAIQDA